MSSLLLSLPLTKSWVAKLAMQLRSRRLWLSTNWFQAAKVQIIVPGLISMQGWRPNPHCRLRPGLQIATKTWRQAATCPISHIMPQLTFFSVRWWSRSWLDFHCPRRALRQSVLGSSEPTTKWSFSPMSSVSRGTAVKQYFCFAGNEAEYCPRKTEFQNDSNESYFVLHIWFWLHLVTVARLVSTWRRYDCPVARIWQES
jgi:hypothetical protein